jgi:hypothetical protein
MATEAKVILAFVKNAGPRVHVAFEEGTQAQWLHDLRRSDSAPRGTSGRTRDWRS